MKITKVGNHQAEIRIQHISMEKIDVPPSQRGLRNLTALVASIQRLRLLQPILVVPMGPRYRVLDGQRRYHACKRLAGRRSQQSFCPWMISLRI